MCQALYVTMHLCRSHSSLFTHHERNTWSSQHTQPCSTHHNFSRRQIFTRCQSSFSMPTLIIATWWTSPTSTRIVFILTVLRCPCRRRSIEFSTFVYPRGCESNLHPGYHLHPNDALHLHQSCGVQLRFLTLLWIPVACQYLSLHLLDWSGPSIQDWTDIAEGWIYGEWETGPWWGFHTKEKAFATYGWVSFLQIYATC